MVRGPRSWHWLLAGAFLLAAVAGPGHACAQDFDAIDQADVLQKRAIAAAKEGNWALARQLAEEVLTLDVSFATAPSRLVLARALQKEQNFPGALYELRQLEQLEGVSDKLLDEVADLKAETEAMQAREERLAARPEGPPDRGVGIGMLAGGAAPLIVGGVFVFNDVHHAAQQQESGTWAVIGGPILATGIVLEVVGAALLARDRRPTGRASFQIDGLAFGADPDQVWLGVVGRF